MSTHVQQYQVVEIGLPEKSCRLQAVGSIDLDSESPHNFGKEWRSASMGIYKVLESEFKAGGGQAGARSRITTVRSGSSRMRSNNRWHSSINDARGYGLSVARKSREMCSSIFRPFRRAVSAACKRVSRCSLMPSKVPKAGRQRT